MVTTERYTICQRGTKNQNYHSHKLLKSGSTVRHDVSPRLCIPELSPICESRIRTGQEKAEDCERFSPLRLGELSDNDDCLWLSSGSGSSPPFPFEDYRLSCYLDLQTDAQFISSSSTPSPKSASTVALFDGSRVNPIEEAHIVLDQRTFLEEVILQENLEEQEVVSWLETSIENESTETKGITHCHKFSFFNPNLYKYWKWSLDRKSEFAYFQSDFPTPVHKKIQSSTSSLSSVTDTSDENSLFSSSSSSDHASEVVDLEEFSTDNDKPLFWPSDWDWVSETKWDLFVMSPRKNIHEVCNSPKTSPQPLRLRVFNGKLDLEKGCKKRLMFGTGSNSSTSLDSKSTNGVKDVRRMRSMPSRLRKSTKTSTKIVPLEDLKDDNFIKKTHKHKVLLEDLLLVEKLNAEPAIETVLGLDEFDGHEGVDFEFNKDDFSLDVIL